MGASGLPIEERILAATSRVLERAGPAFTIQEVAAEAGASRMTLHRHQLSRPVLLVKLRERLEASYREQLWEAIVATGSARERLEAGLLGLCDAAERHRALLDALPAAVHDELFHEDEKGRRLTRPEFVAPLARLLRDGELDGTLAAQVDPEETATIVFNQVGLVYRHLRSGHGWDRERAARGVVRLSLEGLACSAS